MEEYLENLEHQLEVSPPEEDRVATYQKMATIWEEKFAKPDRASEVLEKILLIDDQNAQGLPRSRAPLSAGAQVGGAGRDLPQAHPGVTNDGDRADRSSSPRWGRSTRRSCAISTSAIESYNDVLSVEAEHPEALAGIARLYEETEQWDRPSR